MMRLARYIAQAGVASRRNAELLIRNGVISVNGAIEKKVSRVIDETQDIVRQNGSILKVEELVYYILNKPIGYVCSARDAHNLKLVTQLVPAQPRVYPVGRLDKDSSGLLLLTNDGDFAYRMTHPKHAVPKIYEVTVDRFVAPDILSKLQSGIRLPEGKARVDELKRLSRTKLRITIHQGWHRQIRRMLGECGCGVVSLIRISEGSLVLGNVKPGAYQKISKDTIE